MDKPKCSIRQITVAVAMLLMFVIVVCMGTITYSRYTSSDVSSLQATAAKWGYVITMDASNFGGDAIVAANDGEVSLSASNLVATPGASGSVMFALNGRAEVLSKTYFIFGGELGGEAKQISLTYEYYDEQSQTNSEYTHYPINWSISIYNIDETILGLLGGSYGDGEGQIPEGITAIEDVYMGSGPTVALMLSQLFMVVPTGYEFNDFRIELYWEWGYSVGVDTYDTILGRLAAGETLDALNAVYGQYYTYTRFNTAMNVRVGVGVAQVQEAT